MTAADRVDDMGTGKVGGGGECEQNAYKMLHLLDDRLELRH